MNMSPRFTLFLGNEHWSLCAKDEKDHLDCYQRKSSSVPMFDLQMCESTRCIFKRDRESKETCTAIKETSFAIKNDKFDNTEHRRQLQC